MLKFYVLIRDDLTAGQQAVQAGHALAQFGLDHPDEFEAWQDDNNTLIYLSVSNVEWWSQVLTDGGFKHSMFWEPDYWDPSSDYPFRKPGINTAIAVAPDFTCQYLLFKDLPLALSEKPKRRWWNRG